MDTETTISLTVDIVSAHVRNNTVSVHDIPALIANTYRALNDLTAPAAPAEPEKPKGAVPIRGSIKPDAILSMIDGRPYKMLRRHITIAGYTPETYRATFGLPADYPMVAPNYAEQRRDLAKKIGLGTFRKGGR